MAYKTLKKGVFITFEGVEGCGKSTHARKVNKMLKGLGFDVVFIREPGGTRIGEKIRSILLDTGNNEMALLTELFLFEANRAQIVKEIIKPALREKKIVISDRFSDSTTAYQGYADRLDIKLIEKINRFASDDIKPDLTIILDIHPKTGLRRAVRQRRKDRMEVKLLSYHNRVRQGYKHLARRHKKRIRLIKVREDINKTEDLIRREILRIINLCATLPCQINNASM